jgi:hypothetical protein
MYTLEQLEQKNIKQLKEIGHQLNVLPEADRRCRQNWIDVIVGVNPPLLQLLQASPAVSVVEQAQPIIETVETLSVPEVELVQEPLEITPLREKNGLRECLNCEDGFVTDRWGDIVECPRCDGSQWVNIEDVEPQAQEPIAQPAENTPGVDSGVDVDLAQEPIAQAAETSPGVGIARRKEPLIETVKTSPGVKTEATAIGLATKNPILTGLTLSDRFLARYAPPQPEIIHFQSDADGQLSLLNFEIESVDEPPDPDDFEFLDAFREAIARWDFEHNEVK